MLGFTPQLTVFPSNHVTVCVILGLPCAPALTADALRVWNELMLWAHCPTSDPWSSEQHSQLATW